MRLYFRTVLAVVIVCVLSLVDLEAKGRGGGKGHGHGASKRPHSTRKPVRGHKHSSHRLGKSRRVKPQKVTGKQRALDMQRRNAERILNQRQITAQRLRDISAQNGNERLLDTADKMEQSAQQQYDKRLEKINASQDHSPVQLPDHHAGETIAH